MKASIDESTCTGCGVCSDTCPAVFELGDDNIAKVKVEEVPADAQQAAQDAAATCPVTCITLTE